MQTESNLQLNQLARANSWISRVAEHIVQSNSAVACAPFIDKGLVFNSPELAMGWLGCQDARQNLLASFILGVDKKNRKDCELPTQFDSLTIVRALGGVVYSSIGDTAAIQIPKPINSKHSSEIIAGIYEVYEQTDKAKRWIIDLSAQSEVTIKFVWTLIAFRDTLKEQNRSMHLVWLKPSALNVEIFAQTIEAFNLTIKAGHLFSKVLVR